MFYYYYHFFLSEQKVYNWVMEKKQKIAMKKLKFVIVVAPGSNCQVGIVRGNCPDGGIVLKLI